MPYRDVWDFKPPGIFLVFALARGLFGANMLAPRLVEVAGLLLAVRRLHAARRGVLRRKRVGLIGGALAALVHAQLEFWHTAQPETFGGFLTIGALVLTVADKTGSKRWFAWLGVGVAFGCAFLLKPPLGGGAFVCAAYFARAEQGRRGNGWRASCRRCSPSQLGGSCRLRSALLWFRLSGAWADLRWTMFDFTPGYTALSWEGRGAPQMFYWATRRAVFQVLGAQRGGFAGRALDHPDAQPRARGRCSWCSAS